MQTKPNAKVAEEGTNCAFHVPPEANYEYAICRSSLKTLLEILSQRRAVGWTAGSGLHSHVFHHGIVVSRHGRARCRAGCSGCCLVHAFRNGFRGGLSNFRRGGLCTSPETKDFGRPRPSRLGLVGPVGRMWVRTVALPAEHISPSDEALQTPSLNHQPTGRPIIVPLRRYSH